MYLKKHIKGFFVSTNRREKAIEGHRKMNAHPNNNNIKNPPKRLSTNTLKSLFDLDSKKPEDEILSMISYCTFTFTFNDPSESPSQLELKRDKLIKVLSILKPPQKPLLEEQVISAMMNMISANLFRPLPPPSKPSATSNSDLELPDEEDPIAKLSKMWSHLQIVYEILLRLIINTEPKALSPHVDHGFLVNLLSLFQSEDPRERESLKNVYHRIYLRFTFHRAFMRKSMNDVLLNHIFDADKHSGIGELLEIWGSIINGFAVPLKEEHKLFLMRVLIPLHKTKGMQGYHRQLAYCVSQFVQKEPVLGGVVVRGVLKYWPLTNCQKEVLLLGQLEELIESIDTDQYRKLALPLCTQITKCLNSWNSQVAERALYLWNNEHFVKMASMAIEEVLPIVVEGMEKNLKWHWSKSIRELTKNIKSMLEEMEPILYNKYLQEVGEREFAAHQAELKRKEKWDRIELEATRNYGQVQQQKSTCVFLSH